MVPASSVNNPSAGDHTTAAETPEAINFTLARAVEVEGLPGEEHRVAAALSEARYKAWFELVVVATFASPDDWYARFRKHVSITRFEITSPTKGVSNACVVGYGAVPRSV